MQALVILCLATGDLSLYKVVGGLVDSPAAAAPPPFHPVHLRAGALAVVLIVGLSDNGDCLHRLASGRSDLGTCSISRGTSHIELITWNVSHGTSHMERIF